MSSGEQSKGAVIPRRQTRGGLSARRGLKYQDHVAVFFVLAMIAGERLTTAKCEAADVHPGKGHG